MQQRDRYMKISNLKDETENNLEETSVSAAISGAPATETDDEDKLREVIRNSIEIYSRKRNKSSQAKLQETQIREIVRFLIKEQDEAEEVESSGNTTWKNVLGELLNYMIPLMREKYTQLQTNMTERAGFKDYVQTYFNSQFNQVDNADAIAKQKELEEQESVPQIDQIKVKVKSKNKDFIDVDDKSQDKKISKKKEEEPAEKKDAQTYEEIGQNFAEEFVKSIGDRVKEDYSKKIPGQDDSREEFKRVFFGNIESWYEIWDENEPVSQADASPAELDIPLSSGTEDELVEPEAELDTGDEVNEDLFELLNTDLE